MTTHAPALGSSSPVLSAYRRDVGSRVDDPPFGPSTSLGLTAGMILSHALLLPRSERGSLIDEVRAIVRGALGDTLWSRGPLMDAQSPANANDVSPRWRMIVEMVEDDGALHLADALIETYTRVDAELSDLERARLDALRARLAWKRGDHVAAQALYRRVASAARRQRSPELRVRSYIGTAVIARLKGNYPEAREAAERAVKLAERHSLNGLASIGHHSLMVSAAVAGDIDTAVHHSWLVLHGVRGDPAAEAAALVDMAQLFLDAGRSETAATAFAAALQRPMPQRVLLPALGGAALAAAALGDGAAVTRLAARLRSKLDDTTVPYLGAASQLDMAEACARVGDRGAAVAFQRAASRIADMHQYHELAHRAAQLDVRPSPVRAPLPLAEKTLGIGAAVRQFAGATG